jgi:hypothetical protein
MNTHRPPVEDNFYDKPVICEDCIQHMGYIDKGDRMANSFSLGWGTWKWKKIFFHLLDLTAFCYPVVAQ